MSPILGARGGLAASAYGFTSASKSVVTGGTLSSDATYFYRAFTANGTLTVTGSPLLADILVIAGGGGGGAYNESPSLSGQKRGSPGGAGGLLGFTGQSLAATTHNVTVGAGGPGTTGNDNGTQRNGTVGNPSQFASLTQAAGGGRGVGFANAAGGNGGSGGGGMAGGAGGSASPSGQGNNGGAGDGSFAGGGGGATVAGQAAVFLVNQGAGGNGSSAYSAYGAATGTGQNISGTYWYAGGGGNDLAGNGGGGTANVNGTANTGGGGGGDNNLTNGFSSGNGGSGIVIVRYLKTAV